MTFACTHFRTTILLPALLVLALGTLSAPAAAQSEAASRHSDASLAASLAVPVAATLALSEGARFSVAAVQFSGEVALVTVSAAAAGSAFVVRLSAEAVHRLGIAAGTVVVVAAVATGWILSAGGQALCYIADAATRPLIHSRRIAG